MVEGRRDEKEETRDKKGGKEGGRGDSRTKRASMFVGRTLDATVGRKAHINLRASGEPNHR